MSSTPRFVFLGGVERSGTSLLQLVLCAHSRVVGGPELMFGGRIAALYRHMTWIAEHGPASYRQRLLFYVDQDQLGRLFRGFYRGLLTKLTTAGEPCDLISEKTPSNIFAARDLLAMFPSSRFVHLVRDGRDVIASHRDVRLRARASPDPPPPGLRVRQICQRWTRAFEVHLSLIADPELSSRYHWLRYEDLVREPRAALGRVMAFLDLEVEAAQLRPETRVSPTQVIDGIWHLESDQRRPLETSSVGRWRRDLGALSSIVAALWLARGLEHYGYRPTPGAILAGAPLRALASRIGARRSSEV